MKFTLPALVIAGLFSSFRPAAASVDQGLLALVPESTVMLAGIDVEATRNSGFGQFMLQRMDSEDQHFQKFTESTGLDPRRDLQNLLFASFGQRSHGSSSTFGILARGTFDPNRMQSALKAKGAFSRQSYDGTTLFISHEQGGDTAYSFPGPGLLAIADVGTMKSILELRTKPGTLDPGLLDRVNRVGSSNNIWFASLLSGSFLGNQIPLPGNSLQLKDSSSLQSIIQSTGGLQFGNQVKLSFDATTRSSQDATSLADIVRFVSSMVQTQRQSGENGAIVAAALDHMNLQTSGSELHMDLSISEKNLETLAAPKAVKPGQ